MRRPRFVFSRLFVVAGLLVSVAVLGVAVASGVVADNGVLNQTKVQDPVGDSSGPDLSSLTVTSYADGTVSFAVGFANRDLIAPGESVQIFVDLNGDGAPDLNFSIWPFGDPSYLAHWTGSDWAPVRQLPELVQANGSFSIRLSLTDLGEAAAVPAAPTIGLGVAAYSGNPATTKANDWLPDNQRWIQYQIAPPTTATTPTTASTTPGTTTSSPPQPVPAHLTIACTRRHTLRATLTPSRDSKVVSVSFYANGKLRLADTKAPYVDLISATSLHTPITITAAIHLHGDSQTLHSRISNC
jgi:hypothetical protein